MSIHLKIVLIIIALAYLISPLDLIPDLYIPFFGWIDDAFLIGMILYYLRFGRLPVFFNRKADGSENATMNRNRRADGPRGNSGDSPSGRSRSDRSGTRTDRAPYDILGVSPNASKEEIQAAYRTAVKQYHPDRVAHLGKELQDLANKKFIEIKKARNAMMGEGR